MKLDNWSVSTLEASSESEDILSLFLYEHYLGIDTDTIKITEGSN